MTETETPTPPGLFLILDASQPEPALQALDAARASAPVEVVLIKANTPTPATDNNPAPVTKDFIRTIQAHNIAVLIEDDISTATNRGADGVHLNSDSLDEFTAAIELIGNDQMIIGAMAAQSRDAAMILAEQGCTYMAIQPETNDTTGDAGIDLEEYRRPPTIEWWVTLFETPSVAWNLESIDDIVTATETGADFVAIAPGLWQQDGNTGQIMTTIIETINNAVPKPENI